MPPALLTAVDSVNHIHLIVGSDSLATARCNKSLEAEARPIVIAPESTQLHHGLQSHLDSGRITWSRRHFQQSDLTTLGRDEVDRVVDAVFITTTPEDAPSSDHISRLCRRLRIPVNKADRPDLCTFTLLSTHTSGPVQIGVTTSGRGCKLAARIKREIAAALPSDLGQGVERLGQVRRRIWLEDNACGVPVDEDDRDDDGQHASFNKLVDGADAATAKLRRTRWLSQICEYWPLRRLAVITDDEIESIMQNYAHSAPPSPSQVPFQQKGRIVLAGSGPGHPDLLTNLTMKAIQNADFILADKLVPSPVLDLIPRRTPVHIARKFPGNAEAAQEELLSKGLEALERGDMVLRLKQGDPYLYGRGAEELDFFRSKGFKVSVIPGITSALSAPLCADIPVTHRAVSDQVLICTGTGRKGAAPDPPAYLANQTVVFLMALHRLADLVASLHARSWPSETPCAVIERASCCDQRVVRTTLEHVCAAIDELGSRPPGLLVVGRACHVLNTPSDRWTVTEGFAGFDDLQEQRLGDLAADLAKLDGVVKL